MAADDSALLADAKDRERRIGRYAFGGSAISSLKKARTDEGPPVDGRAFPSDSTDAESGSMSVSCRVGGFTRSEAAGLNMY